MPTRKPDIIDGNMKCTKCLEYYLLTSYPIRKDRGQPYRHCLLCKRKKANDWQKENAYKVRISHNNFRIKHREIIQSRKIWYANRYYEKNKEMVKEKMRVYSKTKNYYDNVKKRWRKWYDIGDDVMMNDQKFKIVAIRPSVWYVVRRRGQIMEITVPRRKLTPIKYPIW